MKNFVGVRSIHKDTKPYFRFYSAPLGEVVEANVEYRRNGRTANGYYLSMTVKTVNPDGSVEWMPFSAPSVKVLLGETARFNLATLQGFAVRLDAKIPELAEKWPLHGDAAIQDAVAFVLGQSANLTLTM